MIVYGLPAPAPASSRHRAEVQAEMIRKHCTAVQLPEPVRQDFPGGKAGNLDAAAVAW